MPPKDDHSNRRGRAARQKEGTLAALADKVPACVDERCHILAGIGAVRSLQALDFMREKVPGVHVPDDLYRRLRAVPADRVLAEGIRLAAETVQQVHEIGGVAGVHLLVAGNERAVPEILAGAGLMVDRGGLGESAPGAGRVCRDGR
jgi:methylenetetrahydrofolate reductase (NADPH)